MSVKWCRLGDLVEPLIERCGGSDVHVSGVDINKQFIETRANLLDTDVSKYYVVPPQAFACNLMHIGRDERLPIAINTSFEPVVVTSAYYVFRVKSCRSAEVLEEFLYLYLSKKELDRYTWFLTDSSVRGNLKVSRFHDILVPVPPIDEQRKVVEAWQGLRAIKEQNEQLAAPLLALCRSYLQELKKTWPMVEIGPMLNLEESRNHDLTLGSDSVRGLSTSKEIISTAANLEGVSLSSYKLVEPHQFAYVADTSRRGDRVSLGFNKTQNTYLVSSISTVFSVDESRLNSSFLYLWFCRPEFDRLARFNSWGSARETFNWDDMCRVKIPLPPFDIQQAVVDLYRCANEAKKIAAEADAKSREICPALMQWVVKESA